jgi:hypothetical protein
MLFSFCQWVPVYFLSSLFASVSDYPGSEPPWYFIRQDFFEGLGYLAGMIAILFVLAATWRRSTSTNWKILSFVSFLTIPHIVTSIFIYWRCGDFFDYSHAVSPWPTLSAYKKSGTNFVGLPIGIVLGVLCAAKATRSRSVNGHQEPSSAEKE